MSSVPPARHLLRARDLVDARYAERMNIADLAKAAGLSPAHFSRQFRRTFGQSPHAYVLGRRMERAAAMLRNTDNSVADIRSSVGLASIGSFTSSFGRIYGRTPTQYRASFPPAAEHARVPGCVRRAFGRPEARVGASGAPIHRRQDSTSEEDVGVSVGIGSANQRASIEPSI